MEIKKAYRSLAMRYHPDKSDDPRAAAAFILVSEAYSYLSDPERRHAASNPDPSMGPGRAREEARRAAKHDDWEAYQRQRVREQAARQAQASAESFARSPMYRAAKVVNRFYGYMFLAIGLVIIIGPLMSVYQLSAQEQQDYNYFLLLVPMLLGVGFILGIWYFVFRLEDEEL